MIDAVHAFADQAAPAARLAGALGVERREIGLHLFPDGETLPQAAEATGTSVLYCSLHQPNTRLVPLLLAADALRRRGAEKLVLCAPYLCYLRQDTIFQPGESLSRDVIAGLLSPAFDAIVTAEPHLHRTTDLSAVFGGRPVAVVEAAEALCDAYGRPEGPLTVVGPDVESTPWARRVGERLGAPAIAFAKRRLGDRSVVLELAEPGRVAGRPVLVIDDICASGGTLLAAVETLRGLGAGPIDAAIVHALYPPETTAALRAAGVRHLIATDSCPHETSVAELAPWLARALRTLEP